MVIRAAFQADKYGHHNGYDDDDGKDKVRREKTFQNQQEK